MRQALFDWGIREVDISEDGTAIVPLIDRSPVGYLPLEQYTGLFLTFAETERTVEHVQAFANKYGLLLDAGETNKPESLETWQQWILNMRAAVDLFNSGNDAHKLERMIETFLDVKPVFENHQLTLMPANLLSALWLQLALAVHGKKKYRRCAWCGLPFHATAKQLKPERVFCSNSCRQHDYRRRREAK